MCSIEQQNNNNDNNACVHSRINGENGERELNRCWKLAAVPVSLIDDGRVMADSNEIFQFFLSHLEIPNTHTHAHVHGWCAICHILTHTHTQTQINNETIFHAIGTNKNALATCILMTTNTHTQMLNRMNVTLQGGQTLPGMQNTINSNHMSGSSQLMPGFPLKSSQPYSPSR